MTDYSLSRLKRLFSLSVVWDLCEKNPLAGGRVKFFNIRARRNRYLSLEEEVLLLSHLDERIRPLALFSLHTGLRLGELLALTWGQVDLGVGRFGQVVVRGDTAKDREDRFVPLTETARDLLDHIPTGISRETKVFSGIGGRSRFYQRWMEGMEASGINKGATDTTKVTFHTLRHTYASRLVMAGVDLATVQQLMGHSHVTTTMLYAHLGRHHVQQAVLCLDRYTPRTSIVPASCELQIGKG